MKVYEFREGLSRVFFAAGNRAGRCRSTAGGRSLNDKEWGQLKTPLFAFRSVRTCYFFFATFLVAFFFFATFLVAIFFTSFTRFLDNPSPFQVQTEQSACL